jgi:hypothetical protein
MDGKNKTAETGARLPSKDMVLFIHNWQHVERNKTMSLEVIRNWKHVERNKTTETGARLPSKDMVLFVSTCCQLRITCR